MSHRGWPRILLWPGPPLGQTAPRGASILLWPCRLRCGTRYTSLRSQNAEQLRESGWMCHQSATSPRPALMPRTRHLMGAWSSSLQAHGAEHIPPPLALAGAAPLAGRSRFGNPRASAGSVPASPSLRFSRWRGGPGSLGAGGSGASAAASTCRDDDRRPHRRRRRRPRRTTTTTTDEDGRRRRRRRTDDDDDDDGKLKVFMRPRGQQ